MKSIQKLSQFIEDWLVKYIKKSKMDGFVIGVSGGIDSAVTSTICARTGYPTLCLEMGIHQNIDQVSRARKHIQWLEENYENVSHHSLSLTKLFDEFCFTLPDVIDTDKKNHALANSRARLRMTTLYYFSTINNFLVAGTGNKVEDFGIGFYTKYGDGGVDISPIADLMKSDVFVLAKHLNIIEDIQKSDPTDGLWDDDRTDEDQIGASYEEIEFVMKSIEKNSKETLNSRQEEVLKLYKNLNSKNNHKMSPVPVCIVPKALKNSIEL
ncbi:MAG: NAD(+) synthase [Flavobacteriaceae bacterium]